MLKRHIRGIFTLLLFFGPVFLTFSCAVNPVSGERQLMLLSEAKEMQLGRQTDIQVVQNYGTYNEQGLTEYLNGFCQELGKLSHRANLPYQFRILDASAVNAFAVPGGYVYFTRGILARLNSEAELAGVMGHEIGHITARHSAQQYTRAQLAQVGLGLGMILSDTFQSFGELAKFGVGMLFLRFSRENERQADDLGVEYSTKAGYDASQMAIFFETLERIQPTSDRSGLPSWFSTHPNPVDRIGTVKRRAEEWRLKLGIRNLKTNRDHYLKRIDGLIFGEDPREGYIENGVFYHPALQFQFPVPANWKLENTRTVVRIISENKDAAIMFAVSSARSPEEAALTFVRKGKASVTESSREPVNGLPAYRLISQIRSRQGLLGAMSYFILKEEKVYVFHGLSSIRKFDDYSATFESTMRQFKKLIDPKKIKVRPDRIKIRSTLTEGTLQQALLNLGASKDELEELALLNGKGLEDHVRQNTLLKLVEKGR